LEQQYNKESLFRGMIRVVSPTELVTFAFVALVLILTAFFRDHLDVAGILSNAALLLGSVAVVNIIRSRFDNKSVRLLHTFYILFIAIFVFKTVEKLSFSIHGRDYDNVLIAVDRAIFGGSNPTIWLYQHIPAMPLFVEFLQLCYFMYYLMPVILAIEFYRRRRRDNRDIHRIDEIETLRFVVIYGLLTSYIGYLILPAIGPRFTLHAFWSISTELPGVFLTEPLRWFINLGENIRTGMTNLQAAQAVTRDAFPSGHTEITLVSIILAFRYHAKMRWVILFIGSGLFFSTVYLRYHYVIDVIAGSLFAVVTLYTADPVMKFLLRLKAWVLKRLRKGG
jgi:membrane-associated phospholipid phosphatase